MMLRIPALAVLVLALMVVVSPARAEKVEFYQDPVFQRGMPGEPHPMDDLIGLAEKNDVRAQFILADLYGKGKGGLSRNSRKAQYWFERSARGGYYPSFIRLAALAKHRSDWVEAYKWYTLGIEHFPSGKDQKYCISARNSLKDSSKMSSADIKKARSALDEWKVAKAREQQAQRAEETRAARLRGKEKQDTTEKPAKQEIRTND